MADSLGQKGGLFLVGFVWYGWVLVVLFFPYRLRTSDIFPRTYPRKLLANLQHKEESWDDAEPHREDVPLDDVEVGELLKECSGEEMS